MRWIQEPRVQKGLWSGAAFVLLIITFLSFSSCLKNQFVNWDDEVYLLNNPLVKQCSWANTAGIFFSRYCALNQLSPLIVLTFSIEHYFFGLKPFYYILDNLIIHLINSLLVFILFYRLSSRRPPVTQRLSSDLQNAGIQNTGINGAERLRSVQGGPLAVAFITAVLFGIHPMHVESVVWVVERKDCLFGFFFLGSLLLYMKFQERHRFVYYGLSILCFILSVLSKPVALMLPLILFAVDVYRGLPVNRGRILDKLPFIGIALYLGLPAVLSQHHFLMKIKPQYAHNADYLFLACYAPLFYLEKLFFPARLSCIYPAPKHPGGFLPGEFLASPFLLLLLLALVVHWSKKDKRILFGSLFFFLCLAPAIEMIPINYSMVHDRYTYISSLGLFYLIAEAVRGCYSRISQRGTTAKWIVVLGLGVWIAVLSGLTYERCKVWKDSRALWTDVIRNHPDAGMAYNNRGFYYLFNGGDVKRALADIDRAVALEPTFADGRNNRGIAYGLIGNPSIAIAEYNEAIRLRPDFSRAYNNRGYQYGLLGEHALALADFNKAIRLDPENYVFFNNRGIEYHRLGRDDEAIRDYEGAMAINPSFMPAYGNRGISFVGKKDLGRATDDFRKALLLKPESAENWNNLGTAVFLKGQISQSREYFERSLTIDPNFYIAKKNLKKAIACAALEHQLTQKIRQDPSDLNRYYDRGTFYANEGMDQKARADFDQAQRLSKGKMPA